MKKILLIACLFLHSTAFAAQQDHTQLKSLVQSFIQQQLTGVQGRVFFSVSEIDKRISLKACSKIEAFLPEGSQLIGRVSVGVRCDEANGWSIFIPVQIKITRDLIVSSRSLMMGQTLHAEDIARQSTETTQNIGITDANQVIGKVLRYSISAGYVIREDMLRAPYFVKQGQTVQLSVQGSGFTMGSTGFALHVVGPGIFELKAEF